jgi:hypothetical protein
MLNFLRLYFLYVYYESSYDKSQKDYGSKMDAYLGSNIILFANPSIAISTLIFQALSSDFGRIVLVETYKGRITIAAVIGIIVSFLPMYFIKSTALTFKEIEIIVRAHPFFARRSVIKLVCPLVLELLICISFFSIYKGWHFDFSI